MRDGCPFCDYDGPSEVLYRAEEGHFTAIVFEPLNPVTEGHVLVVPGEHYDRLSEDPMTTGMLFEIAADWMAIRGGGADFNLIASAGAAATQTVNHVHVHVVPRREGDGLRLPWSPA